jgi:hypothetical protein
MTNPDPLLMSADIALLEGERPDLDVILIAAIYHHLLAVEGRQPTLREFRKYVDRVSCLGVEALRQELGVADARRGGPRARPGRTALAAVDPRGAGRVADSDADAEGGVPAVEAPRAGRPGWTPELFGARYRAARERATPPHTYRSVAAHFVMLDGTVGADPDHLRKLVRRFSPAPR